MTHHMTRIGLAASLALVAVIGLPAASSAQAAKHASAKADIVDTALNAGDFSVLIAALQSAGLKDTLKGAGPFTLFAPNDAAFQKLPPGTLENLLKPENKQQLVDILTYHVLNGKVAAKALSGKSATPATVQGSTLALDGTGGGVRADNANVIKADMMAKNGIIHVIDSVLIPPSVAAALAPAPAAGGAGAMAPAKPATDAPAPMDKPMDKPTGDKPPMPK